MTNLVNCEKAEHSVPSC